jgi:hypothetical protein
MSRLQSQPPKVRAIYWLKFLAFTPFKFESSDISIEGKLQFRSLDCITAIYLVMALSLSNNEDELIENYQNIRYLSFRPGGKNAHCIDLFHFACESLLLKSVDENMLQQISIESDDPEAFLDVEFCVKPMKRPIEFDGKGQTLFPLMPGRVIKAKVMLSKFLTEEGPANVEDGDLVVFTKGPVDLNGMAMANFICHVGFVERVNGCLTFWHSTKHYFEIKSSDYHKTLANHLLGAGTTSGHYFPCGLSQAAMPATPKNNPELPPDVCIYKHGMVRSLAHYARENFLGVIFLRLTAQHRVHAVLAAT